MNNTLVSVTNLYKKVRLFFIGAIDENGFPNIKVVFPVRERHSITEIYFSTNTSSRHIAQYQKNPNACVYFFSFIQGKGVLLTGTMEVMETQDIKSRFWQRGDTRYYPKGVADPDYCILKFTPQSGRYYHKYKSASFELQG